MRRIKSKKRTLVDGIDYWFSCFESLQRESKKIKVLKDYRSYNNITQDFTKHKRLMAVTYKNTSFQIFIDSLPEKI